MTFQPTNIGRLLWHSLFGAPVHEQLWARMTRYDRDRLGSGPAQDSDFKITTSIAFWASNGGRTSAPRPTPSSPAPLPPSST